MDRKEVLETRGYLSDVAVWPSPSRMDLGGWLDNFDQGLDSEIAIALLEAHVHIDEEQIVYAVASTIRGISSRVEFGDSISRAANWSEFVRDVLISFPLSRSGDPTASGYVFARIAKRLRFEENRILDSEHLIKKILTSGPSSVIFLDDLAASGTQFTRDWRRRYQTDSGKVSLADLQSKDFISSAYYLPVVATQDAITKIESECGVIVAPTYSLDRDYQALDANTRLVPVALRPSLPEFFAKYSPRTGRDEYGPVGYGDLGLALSFHHSCPNNTLPVLQWSPCAESWRPLLK
ncbi:phosphoribosyltransferase-like protein [Mycetocola manganoxydans]|uniref:phosphoribosyltransferase-like protein n=1 Tax=Mycetocola manganoxydans TaxID=699879 RepID=UPI0011C453B6|nr:hypothetical protein [Mycetocola manganoxydans]